MRILIAAPPKAGNFWLKCLLGSIYGLETLQTEEIPDTPNPRLFEEWVGGGGWRDGTIFHQHYDYTPEFCDAVEAVPARLVTIVRDPYDAFVSLYFIVQRRAEHERFRRVGSDAETGGPTGRGFGVERLTGGFRALLTKGQERRPGAAAARRVPRIDRDALVGKPIDHPDALRYLADRYGNYLRRGNDWLHGGRAVPVRYEDLHADPLAALGRATERLGAVEPERIAGAVAHCSAEAMRQRRIGRNGHVRTATVGDSSNHLSAAHLAVFRERHADQIRALGYEVR